MDYVKKHTPDFHGKIDILPTAAKAAGISAGAAILFNLASEVPVLSGGVNAYRKVVGSFLQKIGGPGFDDPDLRNAGATTLVDFVGACVTVAVIGRIGADRVKPVTDALRGLWNRTEKGVNL